MKLYPKIPHLPGSRTGIRDRHCTIELAKRLLEKSKPGDTVIVQEKLDGSNVIVSMVDGQLVALGRDGKLCRNSRNTNRRAFAVWLEENQDRFGWLKNLERLACEWLPVAHGTRYDLPHEPIVALDFFDAAGTRATLNELQQKISDSSLQIPHILHVGNAISLENALIKLGTFGFHGALDTSEGLVYRLERENKFLMQAKFVRHEKIDGLYLSDHTGLDDIYNSFLESGKP
jgi:RNA ligase